MIDAGCKAETLDYFRDRWQLLFPTSYATRQKDDLDRFKSEIDSLAGRLERIAADAEQLGQRETATGLAWKQVDQEIQALAFDSANKPGAAPPPDFFTHWPAAIRFHVALLKKLRAGVARLWSPRHPDSTRLLLLLQCYCYAANGKYATAHQIADILGADEDAIRMRLSRMDGDDLLVAPGAAWRRDIPGMVDELRKEYASICPAPELPFAEWMNSGPKICPPQ